MFVHLPTPNSYVEMLTPNVIVLEGGAFRRCLGLEGGSLMSGISALIKETRELSPFFYHVRRT